MTPSILLSEPECRQPNVQCPLLQWFGIETCMLQAALTRETTLRRAVPVTAIRLHRESMRREVPMRETLRPLVVVLHSVCRLGRKAIKPMFLGARRCIELRLRIILVRLEPLQVRM